MTDREMLEFAAKAAGWFAQNWAWVEGEGFVYQLDGRRVVWNPRDDDGDSFRLMVALRLCQLWQHDWLMVYSGDVSVRERDLKDPRAATRRAITRAAAEIGRAMG